MNFIEDGYDDTVCAHCGTDLPEACIAGTAQWAGYCTNACEMAHVMLEINRTKSALEVGIDD